MVKAGMISACRGRRRHDGKAYSGKKMDEIARGGRYKGSTSWFETYATAVIASLSYLPHIAIRPVHAGDAVDKKMCVNGPLRHLGDRSNPLQDDKTPSRQCEIGQAGSGFPGGTVQRHGPLDLEWRRPPPAAGSRLCGHW